MSAEPRQKQELRKDSLLRRQRDSPLKFQSEDAVPRSLLDYRSEAVKRLPEETEYNSVFQARVSRRPEPVIVPTPGFVLSHRNAVRGRDTPRSGSILTLRADSRRPLF